MPLTTNLEAYIDCAEAFATAEKLGGARVRFPTPGQAHRFRQRSNYYRKLLGKMGSETYGIFILRIENCDVIFAKQMQQGIILDAEGNPVEVAEPVAHKEVVKEVEDIEEAARAVARKLGLSNG